jgi:hypothetical protein
MDTAPFTDIGQFPRPYAFNPESSNIFNINCNSVLERIARRILPVAAFPAYAVSSLTGTDYTTVGPSPMYTVRITGEPHPVPVNMFCDSRDARAMLVCHGPTRRQPSRH